MKAPLLEVVAGKLYWVTVVIFSLIVLGITSAVL